MTKGYLLLLYSTHFEELPPKVHLLQSTHFEELCSSPRPEIQAEEHSLSASPMAQGGVLVTYCCVTNNSKI